MERNKKNFVGTVESAQFGNVAEVQSSIETSGTTLHRVQAFNKIQVS
jgi:hypothetical protein